MKVNEGRLDNPITKDSWKNSTVIYNRIVCEFLSLLTRVISVELQYIFYGNLVLDYASLICLYNASECQLFKNSLVHRSHIYNTRFIYLSSEDLTYSCTLLSKEGVLRCIIMAYISLLIFHAFFSLLSYFSFILLNRPSLASVKNTFIQ